MQGFINNESWLFFDQPVVGIEPVSSRIDSVVCWKEDFFLFNKSTSMFKDWKLSMMQLRVQFNLTVTIMKF